MGSDPLGIQNETAETLSLYGMNDKETEPFGKLCLTARRMVERGVRFVQILQGGSGGAWDAHSGFKQNHTSLSAQDAMLRYLYSRYFRGAKGD